MLQAMNEALARGKKVLRLGQVATYIPELGKADPNTLAIATCTLDGKISQVGDVDKKATIQSISKIASLGLAISELGEEKVFSKVGVDPTADPFNSIMRLEMRKPHRPQNPLINAGAIVVLSILPYHDSNSRFLAVLNLVRKLCGNEKIEANEQVYLSEKATSDRNRSLAYFLRSVGAMEGDIEDILDSYFHQCGIECSVKDLAVMGATLANDGINPITNEKVLSPRVCVLIRALMATCGLYDGSGEFAVRVGIPAKSGVGGGIVAAVPGKMGVATLGPALDDKGNSVGGIEAMEYLSEKLKLRVL
ncbi:MAG: glutaminase [Thermovirga sp.]|nr:glutaminase [Thermovirga sp.]